MMEIEISNRQRTLPIPRPEWKKLARQVLKQEGIESAEISVAVVDNQTIHRINREHLQHDYATDVITFPYAPPGKHLAGEIVLSAEYALASAPAFGHSADREAKLYLIHGLLHLAGYTDKEAKEARKMKRRQERLLEELVPREKTRAKTKRPAPARRRTKES